MTKPTIRIHNSETDEIIDREMTDAEYVAYKIEEKNETARIEQAAKAEADKAALLAKLGITADEAKLLLS
jgi:hypothetical protein